MKLEVQSTANFLLYLLRRAECNISESSLEKFHHHLIADLYHLCRLRWFPENPNKGSGQRIIRINAYRTDETLFRAANKAHIPPFTLYTYRPDLIGWKFHIGWERLHLFFMGT